MKPTLDRLNQEITALKKSIAVVSLSSRFTKADRKTLLPYYAAKLQKLLRQREAEERKTSVSGSLPHKANGRKPESSQVRKRNPAITPAGGNFERYRSNR